MQTAARLKPQVEPRKQPRKQRELRVVRSRRRLVLPDSSALFGFFVLIAVMLAAGLIFNVSQRALIAQLALENKQLEDQLAKEQLKEQQLQVTKTELSSPYRIEKIAVEELGMIDTSEVDYLQIPAGIGKNEVMRTPKEGLKSGKKTPWTQAKNVLAEGIDLSSLSGLGMH